MGNKEEKIKFYRKKRWLKTIIWRFISTGVTFVIAYLITGSFAAGGMIALAEALIKMVIYYFHERFWDKYTKKKLNKIKEKYKALGK